MTDDRTGNPFAPEAPKLLPRHLSELRDGSGIALDVILERGYHSVLGDQPLVALGFGKAQQRAPGLVVPIIGPDGKNGLHQLKPDSPRLLAGKVNKYETPKGEGLSLDVPPRCRPMLKDPSIPLYVTEGIKKADALASHGACVVGLMGVWGFKGKNDLGVVTFLIQWDFIALAGREVRVTFDSDVTTKPQVQNALEHLSAHLERKGAKVTVIHLPPGPNGSKVGVDDYLLTHSLDELAKLAQAPPREPSMPAPDVELLADSPPTIARPLALIDGRAYAATWLWAKVTTRHVKKKDGTIATLGEPTVSTERRLIVVRDDGRVFGDGGDEPLADLGAEVSLPYVPTDDLLWRMAGVLSYRAGNRPDPVDVLERLSAVFDRYVDFNRSLAEQDVMCRLSGMAALVTWLAQAFTVVGYYWPSGERGSGKTTWGTVWAAVSYLGQVVLWGGTFAALRDLADYGAAMCFDDAENVNDRNVDPDKKALLLAGNRKGTTVPLKEPSGDRGWTIRNVNAYAPRAMTAISLPTGALESRTITIPLVRTGDPRRGNADPADVKRWPHDRRQLVDDLWALALELLPEAERVWGELEDETDLVGRAFEPWRSIIAVARLLDLHGGKGLEKEMRGLMLAYQRERAGIVGDNATMAVIRGLVTLAVDRLADAALNDTRITALSAMTAFTNATPAIKKEKWSVTAKEVRQAVVRSTETDEDGADGEADESGTPSAKAIGHTLKRLRFSGERGSEKGRTRKWTLSLELIESVVKAHGGLTALFPDDKQTPDDNAVNADNAEMRGEAVEPAVAAPMSAALAAAGSPTGRSRHDRTRFQEALDAGKTRDEALEWSRVEVDLPMPGAVGASPAEPEVETWSPEEDV